MKKVMLLILVLFTFTILPLGSMADDNKIPNYMDEQDKGGSSITVQIDDTEDTKLDPTQRKIVRRDAILSNLPTGAVDSGSAPGQ